MHEFSYRCLCQDGEIETGTLAAIDLPAASAELHARGMMPLEISGVGPTLAMRLNEPVTFFDRPKDRDIQAFLRDLSRLLKAGLSIDEALKLLANMQEKDQFVRIIEEMKDRVRQGESLHVALGRHQKYFPIQISAAVQAGENSGTLSSTLFNLSASMDQALSFRERLKSALIYPAILMVMVIATFVIVMTFVLPQFEPIFEGNEHKLPIATQFVLWLGDMFDRWWVLMVVVIAGAIFYMAAVFRDEFRRGNFLEKICRVSYIKKWLLVPEIIRFVRTLGVCVDSGLPLDRSLVMATNSVRLPHLVQDLVLLRREVRQGGLLSVSMAHRLWFPPVVLQFVKVGEQSGNLGALLTESADIISQNFETKLEKTLELVSPLLTLFMGGIVALLVGSVLLGIMSINDVAF